jgi:hypothetical protein
MTTLERFVDAHVLSWMSSVDFINTRPSRTPCHMLYPAVVMKTTLDFQA